MTLELKLIYMLKPSFLTAFNILKICQFDVQPTLLYNSAKVQKTPRVN